jgi:hypothetical protein
LKAKEYKFPIQTLKKGIEIGEKIEKKEVAPTEAHETPSLGTSVAIILLL